MISSPATSPSATVTPVPPDTPTRNDHGLIDHVDEIVRDAFAGAKDGDRETFLGARCGPRQLQGEAGVGDQQYGEIDLMDSVKAGAAVPVHTGQHRVPYGDHPRTDDPARQIGKPGILGSVQRRRPNCRHT
jgi:hypothetical protein